MNWTELASLTPPAPLPASCVQALAEHGLLLSPRDLRMLQTARLDALRESGRVELGETILPALAEALAPSPFVNRLDFPQILSEMLALFYDLKTDAREQLSDAALLTRMIQHFDHAAGGDVRQCADLCMMDSREALG